MGRVALKNGEHLLGRDGDVAVWLESPTVSRHHARIRLAGSHATIDDLEAGTARICEASGSSRRCS